MSWKSLFLSLIMIMLISIGSAQSDVLLEDEVVFEDGEVTHNLTAYANLEDVKIVDLYVSDVSEHRTDFLGENYYIINRSVGDMHRGENVEISYNVQFSDYALLGANNFRYEGEEHRLSPKRIELENSGEFTLWLVIFGILTSIYLVFDFIRSRP